MLSLVILVIPKTIMFFRQQSKRILSVLPSLSLFFASSFMCSCYAALIYGPNSKTSLQFLSIARGFIYLSLASEVVCWIMVTMKLHTGNTPKYWVGYMFLGMMVFVFVVLIGLMFSVLPIVSNFHLLTFLESMYVALVVIDLFLVAFLVGVVLTLYIVLRRKTDVPLFDIPVGFYLKLLL